MFKRNKKQVEHYKTPTGTIYSLYKNMLQQSHLLVAGATGSGKSVIVNSLIHTALFDSPVKVGFILIDPKKVELDDYQYLPHTITYSDQTKTHTQALNYAMNIVDNRHAYMKPRGIKTYDGSDIYVIIDELADLMTTNRHEVQPIIQRLCQIGRSARVHVIACTQCPISKILPTEIKVNFDSRVALRTACKQDSRNIIGITGCENFPDPVTENKAYAYYKHGCHMDLYNVPRYDKAEQKRIIEYWLNYPA